MKRKSKLYKAALEIVAVVTLAAASAPACGAPSTALGPVDTITATQPWAIQFDLTSRISARTYRIYVRKPDGPPPPTGYPVIMVLDGNVAFPIAMVAGLFAEVEGRGNALIVGIGYPSDDLKKLTIMRNRDLTPTQPPGKIQQFAGYPIMTEADFGGSERFYSFLVDELRPKLAGLYPTDKSNQTLAGHSLGGLFVLNVLFGHPDAFRSYVAMSPAIWWNNRSLLNDEAAFARMISQAPTAPRLMITAGSQEEDIPAVLPQGIERSAIAENFRVNGILTNARGLSDRLSKLDRRSGLVVRYQVIQDAHHNTSMPDAITRAVSFAIEGKPVQAKK